MIDDPSMVDSLFQRLKDKVPLTWDPADCCQGPVNTAFCRLQADKGIKLHLKGLNERLRFLKYSEGQYFNAHIDGFFVRDGPDRLNEDRGVLTVQIYLNDDYTGGATRFLHPSCPFVNVVGFCPGKECEKQLCKHKNNVQPGDAIIFQHDLAHQGSAIMSGTKYTCRTEAMYGARTLPKDT
eukprot:TRINITY_DN4750_c0_g1_i1.p3 TRINITY_DN4750_c0_g1~~TRINITY_DN4750_c0_g1_i1.p3  ORF type:complete len:181 (-),score=26.13 TRINITY_DN4750_c0_g1_i1:54-596(-)